MREIYEVDDCTVKYTLKYLAVKNHVYYSSMAQKIVSVQREHAHANGKTQ